tara:strand:- start:289 stop:525 length:237 start_codon:yes stop_codon:yes gene_type:complete
MNYNKPNTAYKFFEYTPASVDGKKFSTQKIKVVYNKETKEVLNFFWKFARYTHMTGYTMANKSFDTYLKAMQDQNITL